MTAESPNRPARRRPRPLHLAVSGLLCLPPAYACIAAYPRWVQAGAGPAVRVLGVAAVVFLIASMTFLVAAAVRKLVEK